MRENVKAMLRDALYDAGRFQNSRMIELTYKNRGLFGPSDEDVNRATYGYYKLCKGGLAVLDYLKEEIGKRSNVKHAGTDTLEAIGECIKYHRNEVQTFFPAENSSNVPPFSSAVEIRPILIRLRLVEDNLQRWELSPKMLA